MLIGRHYQNAYVTRNITAARATLEGCADIRHASAYEGEMAITTPAGQAVMQTRLAFLWIGDLQIELIEPIGGFVDLYVDRLPTDGGMVFHHSCMRVEDWDDFRRRVDRQPMPVVMEGQSGPLRFLYLDARSVLGHYLEYTNMPDAMWDAMGGPAAPTMPPAA